MTQKKKSPKKTLTDGVEIDVYESDLMEHINQIVDKRTFRKWPSSIHKEEKTVNETRYQVFINNDELRLLVREKVKDLYSDFPMSPFSSTVSFVDDFANETMAVITWKKVNQKT